jgi:NAD(P)-dependent dehydrogenase (short-subunit alcohol dehydrogenase family)
MGLLDGKVAVVTGASKGIGRAMSLGFARHGATVVGVARSPDLLEETVAAVRRAGGRALAVVGDAAREDDVRRMVASGVEAFGRIDVLVNNAGDGGPTRPVQDYALEDWRYTIDSCGARTSSSCHSRLAETPSTGGRC